MVESSEKSVIKVTIGKEDFLTRITINRHELTADEPEFLGGGNKGPDPFSLLLASLGSCAVITMRMYANRKQWNLDKCEIELSIEKSIVDGMPKTEILKKIKFSGELDSEQMQRLKYIADACPVQKMLTGNFEINSEII